MIRLRTIFVTALLLLLCSLNGTAQRSAIDRKPAVAGQFYPEEKGELRQLLGDLFSRAVAPQKKHPVLAIISPHAGYVYSGIVAASAFNQIDTSKDYENIFVLGPSHYAGFEGASVYTSGNYVTPLGTVRVNTELGRTLVERYPFLSSRTDAHLREHSIEVQLPFLQYRLKNSFSIVPIVVGMPTPATMKKLGEALLPYFTPKNLFIVSTDFSHYPSYEAAKKVDKISADAVVSNSAERLIEAYEENERKGIPNLATSMCGYANVLAFLYMTEKNPNLTFDLVQYMNAGDSPAGEKGRVVGYCAIAVSQKEAVSAPHFELSESEKHDLLSLARRTIDQYIANHTMPIVDTLKLSTGERQRCGAFVTLNKNNELRGCIGRFDASEPLWSVVQEMAIAAATEDYRFQPVEKSEVSQVKIEISVLTPMKKIHSIDEIEMGKHGVYIKKGSRSGTFLPQVAKETGWSKEEFLGHCAQDKAGIGWTGWKDAEIYTYEAYVFGEK